MMMMPSVTVRRFHSKTQRFLLKSIQKELLSAFRHCQKSSLLATSVKGFKTTSTCNEFSRPKDVADKNHRLAYTVYPSEEELDSNKKSLLMLHGLFGARGNFHSICKNLSQDGRKVVPFDCRNHGESDHCDEMNFSVMSQDAEFLAGDLNMNSPVILGHSLGGKTAMTAALTKPDLWSGLIVADVAPQHSPQILSLKTIAEAMKKVQISKGLSIVQARTQARTQLASAVKEKAVLEFLLTNLREYGPNSINWRFNLDSIIANLETIADFPPVDAPPFEKPTLFIFGENSDHYKNADVNMINALFPYAIFEVLPKTGHFVHAEKPLEFVEIVNNFLKQFD